MIKTRPQQKKGARGKASHTVVWSQRGNCCLRSKELLWSYGLKEETAILGQKNCHGRMVSKRKSLFEVKRIVMVVWSQRGNRHLRSKELTRSYGLKEEIAILGQRERHNHMVSKRKSSFEVKRIDTVVWSKSNLQTWYIFYLKSHPKCSTI